MNSIDLYCQIKECKRPIYSSGYCSRHYNIQLRKKDPNRREYESWVAMNTRCNNPKHHAHTRYSDRGIKVCNRWKKFDNFLLDMGKRPLGTSLDRIDNNKNYNPENCRWATAQQQQFNKNLSKTNTTGYIGVIYVKKINRYRATIRIPGGRFDIGHSKTAEEAALLYDQAIIFFRDKDGTTNIL